ncbi:MAG: hypothetical protein IPM16_13720 [Chloroflexi bacterium]|nr:hypothetical protein [Chloroflexota bacterium]
MADDDLFEDTGDFPFSDLDDEPPRSQGGKRTYDEFVAEVNRRIAVLQAKTQPGRARSAAAEWLGDSADTRAIKPLIQVYLSDETPRGVKRAARSALSKFRALDRAIVRDEGESVEDALVSPENEDVVELIKDLAFNDRPPRRRGRGLLYMSGLLAILLAFLVVVYINAPEDAVRLSDIQLSLGGDGEVAATLAPTVFSTPVPGATEAPTAVPTATPTEPPTLTPTPISEDMVRQQLRELYGVLSVVDTSRGVLDQLDINWQSIFNDPTAGSRLCSATPPDVPADVTLPAGFEDREPSLVIARDQINTGLALLRQGWTYWREGCAAGDLVGRLSLGQQTVITARAAFNQGRTFLDLIPQ